MSGLLLELRRQIYRKHRKNNTYTMPEREYHRPNLDVPDMEERHLQALQRVADERENLDELSGGAENTAAGENICERTQSVVNKDDILLKQIDEFRERAKQLQTMLDTRESKAEELKTLVDERQEKADALGQILKERQEKADGITSEVEKQIDSLIAKVGIKMDEIESSVKEDLGENNRLSKERAEEMKESLVQIQEQLQQAKSELSEKVHSENVKCYRNLQDLFKSMEEKIDRIEPLERRANSTRTCVIITLILTLVNFAGVLGILLLNLGLFTF